MLRKLGLKLGFLVIVVGSVIPVSAASKPGAISGYVRNSAGAPQMGAAVEVLGSAFHSFKVFTDENGCCAQAPIGRFSACCRTVGRSRRQTLNKAIAI